MILKTIFFWGLCLLILIDETIFTFVVPIIPDFLLEKEVSLSLIGFILSFYQISYFFASLYMSKRLIYYNKAHVMLLGQICLVLSNLALSFLNYGLSTSMIIFLSGLLRLLQGLAIALVSAGIYAYVHILFPLELDKKYAILEISLGIGLSLGPVIGGFFYEYEGYTGAFVTMTAIYAAITLILFPFFMKFKLVFEHDSLNEEISPKIIDEEEKIETIKVIKIIKNRDFLLTFLIFVCEYACYNLIQPAFSAHIHDYDGSDQTVGIIFGIGDLTYALTGFILVRFLLKMNIKRKYWFIFGGLMSMISLLILGPEDYTFLPKNLITVSFGMGVLGFAQMFYTAILIPEYIEIFREIDPMASGSEELACGLFNASVAGTEFIGVILGGVLSDVFEFSRGMAIYAMYLLGVIVIFALFRKVSKNSTLAQNSEPFELNFACKHQASLIKFQLVKRRKFIARKGSSPCVLTTVQHQLQHFKEERNKRRSLNFPKKYTAPINSELQNIYVDINCLKKSYQEFHPELLTMSHTHDESFLKLLDEKRVILKKITSSQSQILNYLLTTNTKVINSKNSIILILTNQKVKLFELSTNIMHRRDFHSMFSIEMSFFKTNFESLEEILKDCKSLLAVSSLLSKESQEINIESPLKAAENNDDTEITTKGMHTLEKYDEYLGYLDKPCLTSNGSSKYYKPDKGNPEFLLELQAQGLLKVIFEVFEFLKLGYNDILVNNRKIRSLLRKMIEDIKVELFERKDFFENLHEAYSAVERIIYIRLEKIVYLNSEFDGIQEEILNQITEKFILEFEILKFSGDFFKGIEENNHKIMDFHKKLKLLKFEIKKLRDENKNPLFLSIRLIQSKKTLKFLKSIIKKVNSLQFLIDYLLNSLANDSIEVMKLVEKSKGNFNDRFEKNELQGKICIYNEKMKQILNIPEFDLINKIPRKLSFLLENAYNYLENPNKINEIIEKNPEKSSEIREKLMKFSKDYIIFIDNNLTSLSSNDLKGPEGLVPLHQRLKALDYEIKDSETFEKWRKYLRSRDTILSLMNVLFVEADDLKNNWKNDKTFKETSREKERFLIEIIENLKEILEIDKIHDNKHVITYWDDVKQFTESFQNVKKTENKEKIINFLKNSQKYYRNNQYIQVVLAELLKDQDKYDRKKYQEIKNLIRPINIYKNEDVKKKSPEFYNIASPKEKENASTLGYYIYFNSLLKICQELTPNLRDFAAKDRFETKQEDCISGLLSNSSERRNLL